MVAGKLAAETIYPDKCYRQGVESLAMWEILPLLAFKPCYSATSLFANTRNLKVKPFSAGFGYLGMYPKKPGRFFGYTHRKNPVKNLAKNLTKTHLKPNGILLFNNMFCYFEVLKPISTTLLDILRYSNVPFSILKPKTQEGLAVNNLPTNLQLVYLMNLTLMIILYWYVNV